MASSTPPSNATDSPVLSLIDERLCALREEHNRILQMEESITQGKPSILASIDELENLRPQLSSALQEELYLAAQRLSRDNGGEENNNDGTTGDASGAPTSTEGQGMATMSGYDYEVFLSFRGPDGRSAFIDFLYTSLIGAEIRTFKDNESIRVGEEFALELLQAINRSKISIPIFSKGYASSVWCLKELVQMVECQKAGRQKIMPIFYDVAPAEVRYQTGDYRKAFRSHEDKGRHDEETIQEWRDALKKVSFLQGWNLHSQGNNRREGEFAKRVAQEVFNILTKAYPEVSDSLVNVDRHVLAIMEMICTGTSETRIIGIHGMGGIGKTTIAKIIYDKLSHNFENRCVLRDIQETSKGNGIQCLQNQLISDILKTKCADIKDDDKGTQIIKDRLSNKRVLLLLDDVEKEDHIDALGGKRDWLGKGSKIIITTRNKDILHVPKVDQPYELGKMDRDPSLQLFSKHAFKRDSPLDEYIDQSNRAIGIAGGLPLALKVIGSLLFHIKKEKWDGKLEELENVPPEDVQSMLKISYNALRFREKHIFLDIACLFIGYDKDIVVHFWDKSKFFPDKAMEVLQNMSLISIEKDNKVRMHDQLRDLGREIVLEESNLKIKKQSRVWNPKEGLDLLRRHKGQKEVEALCLKFDHKGSYCFTCEDFKSLSDLRFLAMDGRKGNFWAEELLWHTSPLNVLQNSDLLPQLRWLSWHDIPPTFNITNFSMEDVVILNLSRSEITNDWKGWSHMKVMENLKVLNLTDCRCLEITPDFSSLANLERLILEGCSELVEIHGSICLLKSLVFLDVRRCWKLERLPEQPGGLEALEELRIDSTAIKNIPNCGGMKKLRIFTASICLSFTLPPTIGDLASLEYLSLDFCKSIESLPDSIGNLESLIELDICRTRIRELPNSIERLKILKVVKMEETPISKIPDSLWMMKKLEEIQVLSFKSDYHVKIDDCIYENQSLKILRLVGAKIDMVPKLPESLVILNLNELNMKTFPDLSNLTNIKELDLWFDSLDSDENSYEPLEDPMPQWIGNLTKLESLRLRFYCETTEPTDLICLPPQLMSLDLRCQSTALPTYLSLHPQLKSLDLECPNLHHLPRLPSSLSSLSLIPCMPFCSLDLTTSVTPYKPFCSMDLSNLKKLSKLRIIERGISEIQGLESLGNLQELELHNLKQVEILTDLGDFNQIRSLQVRKCDQLYEIQGELPQSLKALKIYSCGSLRQLADLSSLKGLQRLVISRCVNLVEIQLKQLPQSLKEFRINSLESLQKLPDLSSLKELQKLVISKCGCLVEIQGKQLPQSLAIGFFFCESLKKLPSMEGLQNVNIEYCGEFDKEVKSDESVQVDFKWYESDESVSEGEENFEDEREGEDDETVCEREDDSEDEREAEDDETVCEREDDSEDEGEAEDDETVCEGEDDSEDEWEAEDDETVCEGEDDSEDEWEAEDDEPNPKRKRI